MDKLGLAEPQTPEEAYENGGAALTEEVNSLKDQSDRGK